MYLFDMLRASSTVLIASIAIAGAGAEEARVILEMGRDFPETRLFDACKVKAGPSATPLLAVAGFSQTGQGDVADLAVYEWSGTEKPVLRWRVLRGGKEASSIRTLRAADLDGDGREELVGLGRIGDEHADSRGELQVFHCEDEQWKPLAGQAWQSGQYTHGYGMDIADLNGDGSPEIVTGGFFAQGEREQGELRVWKLAGKKLSLIGATSWGSPAGHTRINSVRIGDITGDGKPEIVAAGRSGQIKAGEHVTTQEADQVVVWRFEGTQFERLTTYDSDPADKGRFREVRLADLDSVPGLELLAVGRWEPAQMPGRGKGGGRGGGTGTGGGRGAGKGAGHGTAEQSPSLRPLFSLLQMQAGALKRVWSADFGDSLGEIRDVVTVQDKQGNTQVLTIAASELKPKRSARLDVWELQGLALVSKGPRMVDLGDETRARQIVLWGPDRESRVLTVGFVHHGEQILGQILDWGVTLGRHVSLDEKTRTTP